jgi:hypothetical protein
MPHHVTSVAIMAAVGLGLAWASQGAYAAQGVELQVSDQGPYGEHLTDAKGISLYLFEADSVYTSVSEIGDAENISKSYVCQLLPLTCLAPDIVEAILDGRQLKVLRLAEMPGIGGWGGRSSG